ncbi:MAG: N-6 DNA methylase, partial [Candidatus Brocadiae bacterium]|nr:N-6 DNA methylase [Candidatus Brocadiia bacterium]
MKTKQNTLWVHADPRDSILTVADKLVAHTTHLMRTARTEEDLRVRFETGMAPLLAALGVVRDPRYEKTIYRSGRADAVHGQVIFEYEAPRAFRSKSAIDHAFEQLVRYISGEASERKDALYIFDPKLVGVGLDGEQIFFVHYCGAKGAPKVELSAKDFVRLGPYPFDQSAAKTLLTYIRVLSRRLLTADELARVFGPEGNIAPVVVAAFADAFANWATAPRVHAFFDEWRRLFGIVYGDGFAAHEAEQAQRLCRLYGLPPTTDLQVLLFMVHTYFALLMKLIAAELVSIAETSFMSSFSHDLAHSNNEVLRAKLEEIESGGVYAKRGITNFLEGDFFRWYLDALSPQLRDKLRDLARALGEFEPATPIIAPDAQRDLLKKLYQYLVPQEVRHDLGEYYTPDWLAEFTINEAGYSGDTRKRFLDPACGSGTFLALAIERARKYGAEKCEPARETAKRILANIWGFDLNPLAVIAARTNYLFALGDLLQAVECP